MGSNINNQNMQIVDTASQQLPSEGPKAIPLRLNFSTFGLLTLDLQNLQVRNFFSMVQTVYIDLSNSANNLIIAMNSGQTIQAKAGTQGYYPVLVTNPISMTFSSTITPGINIVVFLINVPIAGQSWSVI